MIVTVTIIISVSSMSLLASLSVKIDEQNKPVLAKLATEDPKNSFMASMEKLLHIRNRTSISKEKAKILQNVFELNQFPDVEVRKKLQSLTGLPSKVIQVWFQNRRREKRLKQKEQQKQPETSTYQEL